MGKSTKTQYVERLRSFKVINVDTPKSSSLVLVTISSRYNTMQQVCASNLFMLDNSGFYPHTW